jgi:UDP-N-acetylmuramoyl-L-alanyl-D-glutamate--2,6-diaminopimelate ligase
MEAYRQAKLRLFESLLPDGSAAVVNADGACATLFLEAAAVRGLRIMSTGRAGDTLKLIETAREGFSQRLSVAFHAPGAPDRAFSLSLPLVGDFQVENALLAAGLVLATEGLEVVDELFAAFPNLKGVPGRLERVGEVNGALCIVDYAHKPDALAHVLEALRLFTSGRLICVFGCGGDRDRGKRPIMGKIAVDKADLVIVTDDNPRSENPAAIRAEIMRAAPGAREIGDRAEAIQVAVRELRTGDVLVVAGKGHETGQIIAERTLPFSDHEVLRAAIAKVG